MGFFTLDDDEKPKVKSKVDAPDTTKQTEIGKMSGFKSIDDVASAAPSSVAPDATATPGKRGTVGSAPATRETAKDREARLKAEARAQAMQRVGRYWSKRLAAIPFDTWARITADTDMKLSEAEALELAEDYFMTAEAFEIDPTNKWVLLCGLLFTNGALVSARLKKLQDKADLAEATVVHNMTKQ